MIDPSASIPTAHEPAGQRAVPSAEGVAPGHALADHPLGGLSREDLDLITELVLQSGSLKALAKRYSVSYPTIRSRLDRLIERLRRAVEGRPSDPLTELLAGLVERGQLAGHQARQILETARTAADERSHPAAHGQPDADHQGDAR